MASESLKSPTARNYELLFDKDFLKIYISTAGKFLKAVWEGPPVKDNIMEGCEQILYFVKNYGYKKIILDVSQLQGPFMEVLGWITSNYAPRLHASGLLYVAWIYGENSASRISADAVQSGSITDIINIVFDNLENAERWIMAV